MSRADGTLLAEPGAVEEELWLSRRAIWATRPTPQAAQGPLLDAYFRGRSALAIALGRTAFAIGRRATIPSFFQPVSAPSRKTKGRGN